MRFLTQLLSDSDTRDLADAQDYNVRVQTYMRNDSEVRFLTQISIT